MKTIISRAGALLAPFNKALVPLLVSGVLTILASFGIGGEIMLSDLLTMLFTAALVWLVPNLKTKK